MKFILAVMLSSSFAHANNFGYLNEGDQKFFKNEHGQGNNQLERIDMNVKELNKMWGEINSLKAEVKKLREEINQVKGQRK